MQRNLAIPVGGLDFGEVVPKFVILRAAETERGCLVEIQAAAALGNVGPFDAHGVVTH